MLETLGKTNFEEDFNLSSSFLTNQEKFWKMSK